MPRRKKLIFAAGAVLLSIVATLGVVLALDVHLHHKFAALAGLNIWGYRGEPAGHKRPHEIRIVVLGGSTVLGFGLNEPDTFPYLLAQLLNRSATPPVTYSVVNLGYNQAGAYSFRFNLADYKYLDYDIVCLYEGYNDLGKPNRYLSRHEWLVFRLFGYMPILPIIVTEKITQLRTGDVRGADPKSPIVFRPGVVNRTKADALEAAKAITDSIDRQLRNVKNSELDRSGVPPVPECSERWSFYCGGVAAGVDYARRLGKVVIVVTQPYGGGGHPEQQAELRQMLAHRYASDPAVHYLDLGHAVDMTDPTLAWDSMHLTRMGNQRIAEGLLPTIKTVAAPLER